MVQKTLPFILLYVLTISQQIFAQEYIAAAFEHHPYFVMNIKPPTREEALQIMRKNTAVYREQAKAARMHGAQIIVFPEDGIYGIHHSRETIKPYLETIPVVSNNISIIPCTEPTKPNTEILQDLSCIARSNSIALVANMGDIQYCKQSDPNCPKDGRYQYNTDVVFDSDGRLLAKYHKQHLFFEEAFNTPSKCEIIIFVTSFQVRFGVFTCFDMLFKDPSIDLVQTYGVKNIVFPTAWYKGYPMLVSIEFQQAWSRVNCVNLIAANQYLPSYGFTGSGIYDCGVALAYTYDSEPIESRLMLATLSGKSASTKDDKTEILDIAAKKIHGSVEMPQNVNWKTSSETNSYSEKMFRYLSMNKKVFKAEILGNEFTLTKLTSSTGKLSVCAKGLCCNLKYTSLFLMNEKETFAMGAFRGDNPDGYYWEVCLLFKCASREKSSCSTAVIYSATVFQSFTISGNFSHDALVFPTVLSSGVSLLSKDEIKFTNNSISGTAIQKPLLAAALIGRVYSKDKLQA